MAKLKISKAVHEKDIPRAIEEFNKVGLKPTTRVVSGRSYKILTVKFEESQRTSVLSLIKKAMFGEW